MNIIEMALILVLAVFLSLVQLNFTANHKAWVLLEKPALDCQNYYEQLDVLRHDIFAKCRIFYDSLYPIEDQLAGWGAPYYGILCYHMKTYNPELNPRELNCK